MDRCFNVFDLAFYFVLDFLHGCVDFFDDGLFFIDESMYVDLVLFEEDSIFPFDGIIFWPVGILLAVVYLFFLAPLMMANGNVGSYGRFNLQKI